MYKNDVVNDLKVLKSSLERIKKWFGKYEDSEQLRVWLTSYFDPMPSCDVMQGLSFHNKLSFWPAVFGFQSLNSEIVFLRKIWEMLSSLSRVGLSSSKWGSKAVSINYWHNVFLEKIWLWLFRILNVSLDFHYLFVATKATFLRDDVLTRSKIGFFSNLPSLLAYLCCNQIRLVRLRLVQFWNIILTVHIFIYNCYITIIEDTDLAKK